MVDLRADDQRYTEYLAELERRALELRKGLGGSFVPTALIISHYDADGLTSAALLSLALAKLGVNFNIKILEQLTPDVINRLNYSGYKYIFFCDMGSSFTSEISNKIRDSQVIILDHHEPPSLLAGECESDNLVDLNPHRFGIDGSKEVSAAGIVYLFTRSLVGEDMSKKCYLAVVGALGDRQDVGEKFRLVGLNSLIVDEGIKLGIIREEIGLRLYGLNTRPLVKALAYTYDPILVGITGNESAALSFLKSIGVNPAKGDELRMYTDLSREEVRRLATELVKYLIYSGYSVNEAERIFGINYEIDVEPSTSPLRDAREYAFVLNSCGRLGRYGTAIALCMGLRGKIISRALQSVREYRKLLYNVINYVRENMDNIVECVGSVIHVKLGDIIDQKVTGALSSILTSLRNMPKGSLMVVSARAGDGLVKISVRKVKSDVRIDLGRTIADISSKVEGFGGGHSDAGGAIIKEIMLSRFLEMLAERCENEGGG